MTKEQAMALKVGDVVHSSHWIRGDGKCEVWIVEKAYPTKLFSRWEYIIRWAISLFKGWGEMGLDAWHLPSECPRKGSGHE